MKTALTGALALALVLMIALPARAAGDASGPTNASGTTNAPETAKPKRPDAGKITVGFDYWDASGDADFVASGAIPEWGYWGRWRSQLEYELDAQYNVFTIAYALPTPRVPLGFRVRYSTGDAEGLCIDTDWEHPADPSLWLKTESDAEADSDIWSVDVGWWLSFGGSHPERGIELFVGYWQHKADFVVNNIRLLEDPYDLYGGETYEGLVSTWDLEVEAARLGARTELPLVGRLSVAAEIAVLVGRAKGEGNWMLREYTFQQKSDGTGFDALLTLRYAPVKNLAIELGGRFYEFNGGKGPGSGQQPDYEYTDEGIVDEITVDQLGWFLGVSYTF